MPTKASNRAHARFTRAPLAAAILLMSPALPVLAQEIEEVLVTAQKRTENMQDVPISIQTLNNKTIEQLNIAGCFHLSLAGRCRLHQRLLPWCDHGR